MARRREPRYILAREVVIPAGTLLGPGPSRTMRIYPHVEAVLANGPDSCSIWSIDLDEAIATGLVEELT